jgi:hypothetical protein
MVRGIISTLVTRVNKMIHKPIFNIPKVLVKRNNRSIIHPRISAIGPRIPPVFVNTTAPAILFNTLPPLIYGTGS